MPSPDTTATTAVVLVRVRLAVGETLFALCGLEVHVRDLDALEDSERRSRAQCRSRIVGVDVGLQRGRVADHEERVS